MSENRKCWYCGSEPIVWHDDANLFAECPNEDCPNYGDNGFEALVLSVWNTRPIEDALQKRIDELTHKNEVLMDSYLESETINDKGELVGSLQYFRQRIDELEAQLAQVAKENDWYKYPEPPESGAK